MATQSTSQIYMLGPCQLTKNAISMGFVDDVMLELTFKESFATVDKYGDTPVKAFHVATGAKLKFKMNQVTYPEWAQVWAGSAVLTNGTNSALGFGSVAGKELVGEQVVITPEQSATLVDIGKLTLYKCVPTGPRAIKWNDETYELEVELTALADTTRVDGDTIGRFGNTTVAADTAAPTVSSSSPADDATGVSVAVAPTITFNKELNSTFVNTDTVLLFLDATETGLQAPVACTVTYTPSTFIVTITPTSSLTAASKYEIILTSELRSSYGTRFAGQKRSFTTA